MKKGPTSKRYSEAFKRQVVGELERGVTTIVEVRRRYGVIGGVTIRGWLQKYGSGKTAVGHRDKERRVASSRMLVLERERRELEQALARMSVENTVLESLIKEAGAQLGIDLKKTFGTGR
jgi:transposase-like protein